MILEDYVLKLLIELNYCLLEKDGGKTHRLLEKDGGKNDSWHIRCFLNQQYLYLIPPTAVARLLQYSDSRVEHKDGFSSHK